MNIFLQILLLIVGFVALIKGADWFVDGASNVASHFKISKMIIGLTIVAFGTSAPEFAISVQSLLTGNTDMLLGNVIGSNILNILLILGIAAVIRPIRVKHATVKKELPITILFTTLFVTLIADHVFGAGGDNFSRQDGVVMVIFFLIFVYYLVMTIRRNKQKAKREAKRKPEVVEAPTMPLFKAILLAVVGLAGIIVGSDLVVNNASGIAGAMGISEKIIAMTVVAIGTSLPELVTSVAAARKGETDIAIGNIVGSNIFNLGIVTGLPVAMIGGIPNVAFSAIDVVMILAAAVLLYFFANNDRKIDRKEGAVFLLIFLAYYGYLIATAIN